MTPGGAVEFDESPRTAHIGERNRVETAPAGVGADLRRRGHPHTDAVGGLNPQVDERYCVKYVDHSVDSCGVTEIIPKRSGIHKSR